MQCREGQKWSLHSTARTAQHSTAFKSSGIPAGLASKANREVGEHSPDDGLSKGEGQALQEGGEGEGEGIKEEHAPLLPKYWQPLCLQHHCQLTECTS